jgi:RNA polymerase sigma factor (sigma-70 family)
MAPVNRVVRSARQAALAAALTQQTDGALLAAFIETRDEAAFAALVRRHGPMVLGVCRRVLRNLADAEDAFQATFLILARKAASIRAPGAVGNWLYGVAHTTAVKAQAMIRKRRTREREAASQPRTAAREEVWQAVQALLDAELAALPDRYRTAVVLCALEGKTIHDAARQLGWPQGTVASRLARGRALLARRLAKHGLVVSAGALATALAHGASAAELPPTLVLSTVQATTGVVSAHVIALTQGVLQAMFLGKLKLTIPAVLVLALLGTGTVSLGPGAAPAAQDQAAPAQAKPDTDPRKLLQEIVRLRAQLEEMQQRLQDAHQKIRALQIELTARADADRKREKEPPHQETTATAPDGRTIANASGNAVDLVDAQSGKVLRRLAGHTGPVNAVAFSPNGKRLLTGGKDGVRCWDVASGQITFQTRMPGPIAIRFSEDGRTMTIRTSDQAVHEVDAATGKELRVLREQLKPK